MTSLNQQIAEELGYFVATEDSKHITWIHLCNPQGYNVASWTFPIDPYFQEEYWKDFDQRFDSFESQVEWSLPKWDENLSTAIKLADHMFDAPEGEGDQLWWTISFDGDGFYSFIYNSYGGGEALDKDNSASSFCKAWLVCAKENKEYWLSEWAE